MNDSMITIFRCLALLCMTVFSCVQAEEKSSQPAAKDVYLFSYFMNNGQDGLYLAYSHDGLSWQTLNGNRPFLKPNVGGKLMRDPCVIQGPDKQFH